jgi:hypothetical protein
MNITVNTPKPIIPPPTYTVELTQDEVYSIVQGLNKLSHAGTETPIMNASQDLWRLWSKLAAHVMG